MAVIKLTIHAFLADIEAVKADDMSLVTGTDSAQVGSYYQQDRRDEMGAYQEDRYRRNVQVL